MKSELSLALGGAGLCPESGSVLKNGVWSERGGTLSSATMGFPLLCSLGGTTPPCLDVFFGSTGATPARGGEKEDMEKLCWRKAGEEVEDDLEGSRAEGVRWNWPARGVCAVLPRRD